MIYLVRKNKKTTINKTQRETIELFKKQAIQHKTDLHKAIIKSNSWTEEKVIDNDPRIGGLNQLFGRPEDNMININHTINVVEFFIDGHETSYLVKIQMDEATLKMYLSMQKETGIYIDKTRFYVDLDFLWK